MNESVDGYWNLGGPKSYSEADIDAAIAAGALPVEAAIRLKQHVVGTGHASPPAVADEEYFRLISGFNDIFVVIACGLLLSALGWLLNGMGLPAVAAASWGLAEYFVRKKRLALTAIVLLICFAVTIFLTISSWNSDSANMFIIAGAVTAVAVWLHWRRFHVPVSLACGVLAALIMLLSILFGNIFKGSLLEGGAFLPVLFCSGLFVLALAMRWDSSDRARQTRRSDVAFWLHLLAAPLLVHPFFALLGVFDETITQGMAWSIVALYVCIAVLSLIIDRRALMISSLGYVCYAFTIVFQRYDALHSELAPTALVIGAALLVLAALWQAARARVVRRLPKGLQKFLPPVVSGH